MSRRFAVFALALALIAPLLGVSCQKKPPTEPAPDVVRDARGDEDAATDEPVAREIDSEPFDRDKVERAEVAEPAGGTAAELNRRGVLATVYFGFDSSELGDDARAVLKRNADWLNANARWNVVVQGHCDERGTIEYNIALGDRRARTVRDYLGSLGVAANRVRVVSYGEERPADPGHGEASWARNRRAEFVIED